MHNVWRLWIFLWLLISQIGLCAQLRAQTDTGAPLPILSNLLPTSVLANSGSFVLTANGGHFMPGDEITWNGTPLVSKFVDSTRLNATVPIGDLLQVGTVAIAILAPNGTSSASKPIQVAPDPTISDISPAVAAVGTLGLNITIDGFNFTGKCIALWNGATLSTKLISPTQISAYIPAADLVASGTATVELKDKTVYSNAQRFLINSLPVLTSVAPNSVKQGGPSTAIVITGKYFVTGSIAHWNGAALPTTYVSTTMLNAVIPASDTASAGISEIRVTNPDNAVSSQCPFRTLVVSDQPLWTQRLVWAHDILNYTYAYPDGDPSLYDELYPLDMSSAPPSQSPATDIRLAQAEGIDGFAVEIVLDGYAAEPVLAAADASATPFYVAPSIDLSTMAGQSPSAMEDAVVQAVEDYAYDAATHPSAARDSGKLVIWTFDTSEMPDANWADALNRIAAAGVRTTWVADIDGLFAGAQSLPENAISKYLDIFQAGYIWSGARDAYWDQTVSLFQGLGHNWAGSVRAGSISSTQYFDAECTALMRTRWQRNIDEIGGTQWAIASTWNDYSESSGVNPTSTWNMARPDLTAYYSALYQGRPAPNPNAELYVTSPQALNLDELSSAEAMVINPTDAAVTAEIQLFDGNGRQIGPTITQPVPANSVDAATMPLDLVTEPAGGYFRALATMLGGNGQVQQSVLGAPIIVYAPGASQSVEVVYYSIPAYNALPGTVGLTLTANGTPGQATATVIPPAGAGVKFAEILYNTQESDQFYSTAPTSETVSTTGPGFYVARVIDQNRRVGYSNPVYVGP